MMKETTYSGYTLQQLAALVEKCPIARPVTVREDSYEHAGDKATWWSVGHGSDHYDKMLFDDGSADDEYEKRCSAEARDLLLALYNAAPDLIAALNALQREVASYRPIIIALLAWEQMKTLEQSDGSVATFAKALQSDLIAIDRVFELLRALKAQRIAEANSSKHEEVSLGIKK